MGGYGTRVRAWMIVGWRQAGRRRGGARDVHRPRMAGTSLTISSFFFTIFHFCFLNVFTLNFLSFKTLINFQNANYLNMSGPGPGDDPVVAVLPVHLSTALAPNIHLHQYPLLTRPLQVPPSAAQSGKKIKARFKPRAARLEVHVPVDTRPEVWNRDRAQELGRARATDDAEKNMESKKGKESSADQRLSEVRMRSERISERGAYMLGIVRDGASFYR